MIKAVLDMVLFEWLDSLCFSYCNWEWDDGGVISSFVICSLIEPSYYLFALHFLLLETQYAR